VSDRISLEDIQAARERIVGSAIRAPLIRLNEDTAPAEIYLKLENLQPIGAFKIRGASNAMAQATPAQLAKGVWTASAGNMAQGVAWNARRLGIPCTCVVPDHAPEAKLENLTRMGSKIIKVPFAQWWDIVVTHTFAGMDGFFVHPVSDPAVIAGNGTIGLELLEDLPSVEAVIVPYGGGGLSAGIALAMKALKPSVKIYASEVETAAPLALSLAAGAPGEVNYQASFVDGIGSGGILPDMWPLVSQLLDGSIVVSLAETAAALKLMIERNRVVAEGAGATSVAAALTGKAGNGRVVAIVSGGNIDSAKVAKILKGEMP
jgi:threonine dehydratase